MSFLQVTLKEACSDQQIFLPPAGIEPGTSSTRSQCANHSATSLPPFKLRISESVCLFKVTGEYLEKRSCLQSISVHHDDSYCVNPKYFEPRSVSVFSENGKVISTELCHAKRR